MATLTSNSLDGCTSIPNFLPTGTRMTFRNTLPPTSWTKETNSAYNDAALRLATGTVTLGGSSPFLTVFPASQKAVQGSVNSIQSSVSVAQNTAPLNAQTSSTPTNPTTVWQSVTLSEAQIPQHNHMYRRYPNGQARGMALQPGARGIAYQVSDFSTNQNTAVSGHNHSLFSVGHSHAHGASSTQHNHPISSFGTHNHGFTATTSQDFAISYVDIIIAIKG